MRPWTHRRSSSAPVHQRPMEPLESRRLLAATLADGLLTVAGTANNDTISVYLTPGSTTTISVKHGSNVQTFNRSAVQKITVDTRNGHDRVTIDAAIALPITLRGAGGNDTLTGGGGSDRISGDEGNDLLNGNGERDTLYGGIGDDGLSGAGGSDYLDAGEGHDAISGSAGNDNMVGGSGVDTIKGGDGNDNIAGGGGRDIITGEAGDDRVNGDAGNDL